jgi:hypothetical protein
LASSGDSAAALLAAGGSAQALVKDEIARKRTANSAGASFFDTRIPCKKTNAPAESELSPPKRVRHVGERYSPGSCVGNLPMRRHSLGICRNAENGNRDLGDAGRVLKCSARKNSPVTSGVGPK